MKAFGDALLHLVLGCPACHVQLVARTAPPPAVICVGCGPIYPIADRTRPLVDRATRA